MNWIQFEQLLTNKHYTPNDINYIRSAFEFAQHAHAKQKRSSGEPYFNHVTATAKGVTELNLDAKTVAAALLHDVLEDCDISAEKLTELFGTETTFLVEGVTKVSHVRYKDVQRHIESIRKMFLAVAEDVRVVLIKLMDRLHNMQTIQYVRPEKQKRIALETLEIFAPLAYRLGIGHIKGQLEDMAFPIVYPDEYAWVKKEVDQRVPEGRQYLEKKVKPEIELMLNADDVYPLTIDFRRKHYYSLWQKLQRHDMDFGRISDLLAVRIVVSSIEECYKTLGIIHQLWKPLPGRIKDYIALPKPNGYRSLHTTVFCIDNKVTEFQIRTKEIHEEAEHGIAAHWIYSETGKPREGVRADQRMGWVSQLSEWQREIASETEGEEFLESLKIDFFKDRIFVLTPKGEVIDLPAGATPVDFAYRIHSEVGDHMAGVKVNGKMAQFTHELASGDHVEILTQKNKKPNSEWLSFIKTTLAKNRIRAALRKEEEVSSKPLSTKLEKDRCVLHITTRDRVGMLKDISAVFSKFRLSIQNITMNTQNKLFPVIVLSFQPRDKKQLMSILTRLKFIEEVEEIKVDFSK